MVRSFALQNWEPKESNFDAMAVRQVLLIWKVTEE
jgi:hypothetical protein